jgi:LmbE family N-acetylglucosaminyl deacetylase
VSKDTSAAWKTRHKRWIRYVQSTVKTMEAGKAIPLGPSRQPLIAPGVSARQKPRATILLCAPHPDDESLIGALALRWRLETGARVVDCAITLGSNVSQKARRLRELESACRVLGYDLIVPDHPVGFDRVNLANRRDHPEEWAVKVNTLAEIFEREIPDVVFTPHAKDFNTTHVGTHFLVVEALGAYLERSGRGLLPLIETEFWGEFELPNLMVGMSAEVLAIQLMATAEHGGEVRRNPYHLLEPHRRMNNVRRGSEVVGGQGGPAQHYPFAELYHVAFLKGREVIAPKPGSLVVGPKEKVDLKRLVARFLPEGV